MTTVDHIIIAVSDLGRASEDFGLLLGRERKETALEMVELPLFY